MSEESKLTFWEKNKAGIIAVSVVIVLLSMAFIPNWGGKDTIDNTIVKEPIEDNTPVVNDEIINETDVNDEPIVIVKENMTEDENKTYVVLESWTETYTLNSDISEVLTSADLVMSEGEFEQGNNKVDFERTLSLSGLMVETSNLTSDFEENVYLTIPKNGISITLTLDDINFDGSGLEDGIKADIGTITSIEDGSMTISTGTEKYLEVGKSALYGDKIIQLINVGTSSVIVQVINGDSVTEQISLEDTETVNGVRIKVDELFYRTNVEDCSATLIIGDSIETTYQTGDMISDSDDEVFRYKTITRVGNVATIVIDNKEDFVRIRSSEDFKALGIGESILLPANLRITLASITEPSTIEYTFNTNAGDYLYEITANDDKGFILGTNKWDVIFVNASGIYNSDDEFISLNPIELGRTNWVLNTTMNLNNTVDFTNYDLTTSNLILNSDDPILDYYGNLFENSKEWNVDDGDLVITIPRKALEATVKVELLGN